MGGLPPLLSLRPRHLGLLEFHMIELCHKIATLFDSNFGSSLIGALVGAFAGARAAQSTGDRSAERQETVTELRNTHVAIVLAVSAVNNGLALKRQLLKPLLDEYEEGRKSFETYVAHGNKAIQFSLQMDLQLFPMPAIEAAELKRLVLQDLSVSDRTLSLVSEIDAAARGLQSCIDTRARIVGEFRDMKDRSEVLFRYFGLKSESGNRDMVYAHALAHAGQYLDDAIFYAFTLSKDLLLHANRLHKRAKRLGAVVARPHAVDFSEAEATGEIPPDSAYEGWLKGFRKHDAPKSALSRFLSWAKFRS